MAPTDADEGIRDESMTPGAHILSDANLEQGILGGIPIDFQDNWCQILGAVGLPIDWQLDECMDRLLSKSSDPGVVFVFFHYRNLNLTLPVRQSLV
jgi:hypothetical protein